MKRRRRGAAKPGVMIHAVRAQRYVRADSAKKQDSRLIDTTSNCWFQNNIDAGGTHNYRKDVDADEFRFAVIDAGKVTSTRCAEHLP